MNAIGLVVFLFAAGEGFQDSFPGLLNLTMRNLVADYIKSEVLIRDRCILQLLKEAVLEYGSTYMFVTDGHYHTYLLLNLQVNFVHSYYTEPEQLTPSKSEMFDNLLIFQNKFKLRDVIRKKQPYQATKFFLLVRDYQDVIEKFETLWEHRLVNAVASFTVNTTVYYYTYFPYCSRHCGKVGTPHLLAKCDIASGVFSHREKLFPTKVGNLHGCPIAASFNEHIPASYRTETEDVAGWEIDLLKEILDRINGVPKYNLFSIGDQVYQKSRGYSRLVENSEIGGGLVVSLSGLMKTDFCMYGMSLCATWVVPRRDGSSFSADFLTKVFPTDVWILTFLAYIAMATSVWIFFRVGCWNILFKLLPYLLGTTTKTKRTSRQLGAIWLWFCIIMNTIYQSGFQSTLLVPNTPRQISSTSEVLTSNLKILGVADVIKDAIPFFTRRYNISSRRYRQQKLSYEEWFHRMIIKKDSAYLGYKEMFLYHTERTDLASQLHTTDTCVIKYLLAFVLKRNSHLTEPLIKLSNRLNENGILAYFIGKHLLSGSRENIPQKYMKFLKHKRSDAYSEQPQPINMDKMSVVFICLGVGFVLGFAAFTYEVMSTWDWKKISQSCLREMERAWPCY